MGGAASVHTSQSDYDAFLRVKKLYEEKKDHIQDEMELYKELKSVLFFNNCSHI